MEKNVNMNSVKGILTGIVFIEVALLFLFAFVLLSPYIQTVYAIVSTNNVTVITNLQIGNVYPQVESVVINNSGAITLIPNSTVNVTVYTTVLDYNGEADIQNVSVIMFNTATSTYAGTNDSNRHYYVNCNINQSYGTIYEVNATCVIPFWYFAEPGSWNATVVAYDNATLSDQNSTTQTINTLIALGLPNSIDYGIVNVTSVSAEKIANVTNFGNVFLNLSLQGYARFQGDNVSLNCSLGSNKNISINYEKYNLTLSNAGDLSLTQFEVNYTNLTSRGGIIKTLNLPYRQNDTSAFLDDTNSTYWRVYVPLGVAGTCQGNIIFGAVQSAGS